MTKKLFITTAIDYTNGVIHIGHAYEKVLADVVVRFERLKRGKENVHFTTGTDEHGTTSEKAAIARELKPYDHVDDISRKDKIEIDALNVSYDRFIRTTDDDHIKQSTEFFKMALENGDIYKAKYVGYYCEGCEAHKTMTELTEDGKCPNHLTREIQKLDEENYFFRWSKYQHFLTEILEKDILVVKPEGRKAEMLAFINSGLRDITVSRPKYKVSWGIETPNDKEQVIYVWFDALINYLTEGLQKGFWESDTEIVHFVGKDIARWHVLLWPAMLKSVGYRIPSKVYVHGFMNLNGQKISKSLGNIIRPTELIEKFGVDPVRYYLLKNGPIVEDTDISEQNLLATYNSDLANGLGNTVARLAKLGSRSDFEFPPFKLSDAFYQESWAVAFKEYRVDRVLQDIWRELSALDKHINENEPWAIKNPQKLYEILFYEIDTLRKISYMIEPLLPQTAQKIKAIFEGPKINEATVLFPRILA